MADIEKITHIGLVPAELINDLRQIIDSARSRVAATAFQIVAPLARKLSWSHFLIVMPLKTSQEFAWHNISPNCHRRKFSCANCKNTLRQRRIYQPTDDRLTTERRTRKKEINLHISKKSCIFARNFACGSQSHIKPAELSSVKK